MANKMRPIHPGETLEDEFETIGMSVSALARYLSVPADKIYFIINGKKSITKDTALILAKFFETFLEFWLRLQSDFDKKKEKKIEKKFIMRVFHEN